jgi:hypothetical protein
MADKRVSTLGYRVYAPVNAGLPSRSGGTAIRRGCLGEVVVLEDAVVRVADDQLARVPVGGAQIGNAPGVVERLAGDRLALIGEGDLPVAVAVPVHTDGDEPCFRHGNSMPAARRADIRGISHD